MSTSFLCPYFLSSCCTFTTSLTGKPFNYVVIEADGFRFFLLHESGAPTFSLVQQDPRRDLAVAREILQGNPCYSPFLSLPLELGEEMLGQPMPILLTEVEMPPPPPTLPSQTPNPLSPDDAQLEDEDGPGLVSSDDDL